jgi:type I restriction enzyme R subunit
MERIPMHRDYCERPIPDHFVPISRANLEKTRRILPHWEQPDGTYFVTFRQADSISAETQHDWTNLKNRFLEKNPQPWDLETKMLYRRTLTKRMHELLDMGFGTCRLRDPGIRKIVEDALFYFDGIRYRLDTFVIMPNHVHVIFSLIHGEKLRKILHSWKSYTANLINTKIDVVGPFWLEERWDHLIRSEVYLQKYRRYIFKNPIKAGLRDKEYSLWP